MLNEAACWNAVTKRNAAPPAPFVYGVRTTGIYCRPGCSSRLPLRRNVAFFPGPPDAERAGLRACVRCRPNDAGQNVVAATVAEIRAMLDAGDSGETQRLEELAARSGYSAGHLQRAFRRQTGLSPREYAQARRVHGLKRGLKVGAAVTHAATEAGFSSSSRLHAAAQTELAMTPLEYRDGGRGLAIQFRCFPTPLGLAALAATSLGICWLQFGADKAALRRALAAEYPNAELREARHTDTRFRAWVAAVKRFLRDGGALPPMPLHLRGTVFQHKVWRELAAIPAGETRSYAAVAARLGQPSASRAVAGACAANRAALVVPCHRVVRQGGALGGYRWGVETKRALLDHEAGGARR